jgi:hypothetical protein
LQQAFYTKHYEDRYLTLSKINVIDFEVLPGFVLFLCVAFVGVQVPLDCLPQDFRYCFSPRFDFGFETLYKVFWQISVYPAVMLCVEFLRVFLWHLLFHHWYLLSLYCITIITSIGREVKPFFESSQSFFAQKNKPSNRYQSEGLKL